MTQGYEVSELQAMLQYVNSGKRLWCMANHGAFNNKVVSKKEKTVYNQLNDHLRFDSSVSTLFFTGFEPASYSKNPSVKNSEVPITQPNLSDHPIITGEPDWPIVEGGSSS